MSILVEGDRCLNNKQKQDLIDLEFIILMLDFEIEIAEYSSWVYIHYRKNLIFQFYLRYNNPIVVIEDNICLENMKSKYENIVVEGKIWFEDMNWDNFIKLIRDLLMVR